MHLSWLCHLDTTPPKNTHLKDILNLDICEAKSDVVERAQKLERPELSRWLCPLLAVWPHLSCIRRRGTLGKLTNG